MKDFDYKGFGFCVLACGTATAMVILAVKIDPADAKEAFIRLMDAVCKKQLGDH